MCSTGKSEMKRSGVGTHRITAEMALLDSDGSVD